MCCWLTAVTDVITLKWKIPLLSWKDCFSGTTCAIRPLLNVSEEIAAKNQQLPVDGRQKECNYFYLLNSFFFPQQPMFFLSLLALSTLQKCLSYPEHLEQCQSEWPHWCRKPALHFCPELGEVPGQNVCVSCPNNKIFDKSCIMTHLKISTYWYNK